MQSPSRCNRIFETRRTATKQQSTGFSLPEVMVASVILASAATMTAQLSNSTVDGMQRMNIRSKLDSAMAARMEEIREQAFQLHCQSGCEPTQLTKQLQYNISTINPLCETNTLGTALIDALSETGLNQDFNLRDYDEANTTSNTSPSMPIKSTLTASGNQVIATFTESSTNLSITSIVVPHAQGWCP